MGYLERITEFLLEAGPEILMIGAIILCVIMALKVSYEHFSDSSRTGRSYMVDIAYNLIAPAMLFAVGGIMSYLEEIQGLFV